MKKQKYEMLIETAGPIFDLHTIIQSADRIFYLEILGQSADRIMDIQLVIQSEDQIFSLVILIRSAYSSSLNFLLNLKDETNFPFGLRYKKL